MERSEEAIDRFLYRKKYPLQSFTPYQNHPSPNFYKYTRISTLHQPWNPPKHLQFNFSAISKNMIYIESRRHFVRPLSISRIVTQKTQVERERESENKRGFNERFICYSTFVDIFLESSGEIDRGCKGR